LRIFSENNIFSFGNSNELRVSENKSRLLTDSREEAIQFGIRRDGEV